MNDVRLVGLDFGTTTSSAVVASARLAQNPATGRRELSDIREIYSSDLVMTPYSESGLDQARLREYIDGWFAAAKIQGPELFGGGALLTGLAAEQENAAGLVQMIRSRLGNALVATAGDPRLEAWLAFQASAVGVSRSQPERFVVNLDIGGGTTNIALGKNGEVVCTGSLYVGARHVQLVPGSYQIVKLSACAQRLFEHLGIASGPGDCLNRAQVDSLVTYYVRLIESAIAGEKHMLQAPISQLHQQVPFDPPHDLGDAIITVSGGVGELVYAHLAGRPLPPTTFFGDLGIELAARILASARWAASFQDFVPACMGRATVYGLLRHATQVSGSTLYLPRSSILPLRDLPILGQIGPNSTDEQIRDILDLVRRSPAGGSVHVVMEAQNASVIATLGKRIAAILKGLGFPPDRPLVLLVQENVGKALGHYVSEWGSMPVNLMVLDEMEIRDARFVQIGSVQNQVVPVSFHGMN